MYYAFSHFISLAPNLPGNCLSIKRKRQYFLSSCSIAEVKRMQKKMNFVSAGKNDIMGQYF